MSHQLPPQPRANALLEKLTWGRGKKKLQAYIPILTDVAEYFLKELGVPSSVKVKVNFDKLPSDQKGLLVLSPEQTNNFEIKLNSAYSFRFFVSTLAPKK